MLINSKFALAKLEDAGEAAPNLALYIIACPVDLEDLTLRNDGRISGTSLH